MRIEGPLRRRAEPAVVVDARRRRAVGQRLRDRPSFGRPGAGHFHLADDPFLEQLAGLLGDGTAAHLAPLLHDAAVLLGGGDDQRSFVVDVRDRLLDVDVLAGLHRSQRDRRVPVMRRGDDAGVDVLVGDHVFEACRPLRWRGLKLRVTRAAILSICRGSTSHSQAIDTASRRLTSPLTWCVMIPPQPMIPSRTVAGFSAPNECTPCKVATAAVSPPLPSIAVGTVVGSSLGSSACSSSLSERLRPDQIKIKHRLSHVSRFTCSERWNRMSPSIDRNSAAYPSPCVIGA